MRPICIDLFCGYGGWARGFLDAGYRVVGFDNEPKCAERYPGEFHLVDIQSISVRDGMWVFDDLADGRRTAYGPLHPRVIVASPPCNYYSKLSLPASWAWKWKPDDGGKLWDEAERIIYEARPWAWCIENVRGAEKIHGRATKHTGSRYLWGDFPILNPEPIYGKWRTPPSPERPAIRSLIPYPLARALAEACLP